MFQFFIGPMFCSIILLTTDRLFVTNIMYIESFVNYIHKLAELMYQSISQSSKNSNESSTESCLCDDSVGVASDSGAHPVRRYTV